MGEPIILVDSSTIRDGKQAELDVAMKELVAFVEANEDRPILYDMFVDEDRATITVVQIHPDSESVELHMKVAGPVFAKFSSLLVMAKMDVYGSPSPSLMEALRAKAKMLGGSGALGIHELRAGFARLGPR